MTLFLLASAVQASTADLAACCDAAGVAAGSCPSVLAVVTPQSAVTGVLVTGVAVLSCDAPARFDASGRRIAASPPTLDEILTPTAPDALACFRSACAVPADLCLESDAVGRNRARSCVPVEVVAAPPVPHAPVSHAPVPPRAPVAPMAPVAPVAPAAIAFVMPDAPAEGCVVNAALYRPSNDQVDLGDDARVAGDLVAALQHYRAAIVINGCNAFAWAGLGEGLRAAALPAQARDALAVSTRLMPTHHVAWARLGEIEESTGSADRAGAAYSAALAANPSYQPARDALARLTR